MTTPNDPKARAVEIIRDWYKEGHFDTYERMYAILSDRIDQAGLLAKGWVSVSNPPDNKTSWTAWIRGAGYDAPETCLFLDGHWIGPHGDLTDHVVAYQPLPDAPKEPS